jgi:hypothetical protein
LFWGAIIIGCAGALAETGDSPAEKAKRAAMCKDLCNKEHYNIKFIRVDGTMEYYKIGVVSITGKTACECKF